MRRLVTFLLFMAPLLSAANRIYIVELTGEPAAVRAAKQAPATSVRRTIAASHRASILAEQAKLRTALQSRGYEVLASADTLLNALAVEAPDTDLAALQALPGVTRVTPTRPFQAYLDRALPLQKVFEAWDAAGGAANAGTGIKIGMIDSGLDTTHPGFIDASMTAPDGFPKFNRDTDKAATNGKVIVYRTYKARATAPEPAATDQSGHGTSTSMIAAGVQHTSAAGTTISGVAPKAWIGLYKVAPETATNGSLSSAFILQALDDVARDGMDVVNMSFGSVFAGHTDTDPFVRMAENAATLGILMVGAAGNSGPDPNTIGSPATAPSVIAVGNTWNDRVFASPVSLSDGGRSYASVPGSGNNSKTPITASVVDVASLDGTGEACNPLPTDSLKDKIALILRRPCSFQEKLINAQNAGAIGAIIYSIPELPDADFIMSVGLVTLPATLISNPDGNDLKARLTAQPDLQATLDFTIGPVVVDARHMDSVSSRGPSPDFTIRPEMSAVGSNVYTAAPSLPAGPRYTTASGTSLSAPMVTGAAALLKQTRPGLTNAQYRSLLINSVDGFSSTSDQPFDVQLVGSGRLNVRSALKATIAATPTSISFGTKSDATNLSATLNLTNLSAAADTLSLSVLPIGSDKAPSLSTNVLSLKPGENGDVGITWNTGGFEPAAYQGIILVTSSTNDVAARIPYWYGVPSGIPKYLTLLSSPTSATVNTDTAIDLRVTDLAGIPISTAPVVKVAAGTASIRSIYSIESEAPGAWEIVVRMPRTQSNNTIEIHSGDLSVSVVITATP